MNKMIIGSAIAATMTASIAMAASWDMPTPYPEAEFHTKNVQMFVEDVAKATGGSLSIKVHSGQSLFKHPEIKRAVQTNQVPIGEMLMANLQNDDAIFGVDAVPFFGDELRRCQKTLGCTTGFGARKPVKTRPSTSLCGSMAWAGFLHQKTHQ
jgi:TRAP-type C4-dicarboxylate transport system, periplasmic component